MPSDHPESINPTEQIYLALNLFHEQAFAEAQALCDSILRAYPDQVQALQLRGLIALQAGQADVALPDLERCVEDYPTEDSFQINHGLALAALGKTAAAQAAFLQAVSLNPLSPEACYQLGQLALAEADQSLAQKWFLEALARYPNFQAALQGLSLTDLDEAERRVWEWRAQWAQGNDLEATCHQALQQNPEQESLRLLLGEILIQQEKWAEAEAVVFAEQASLSPALLWLQVQVSEACRHRLRWQQALSLLLVQEPDHWLAHQSRLRLLFCEERYTELPAAYEQAVRNSPQSLFRHCYAAALNAGKPDSEQAPLFRKLLVNQALLSAILKISMRCAPGI